MKQLLKISYDSGIVYELIFLVCMHWNKLEDRHQDINGFLWVIAE